MKRIVDESLFDYWKKRAENILVILNVSKRVRERATKYQDAKNRRNRMKQNTTKKSRASEDI